MKTLINKFFLIAILLVGTLAAMAQEEPAVTLSVLQDQKVRTGSTGNEATNYGEDQAISGLSRNGIYEFVGMMSFEIPEGLEGTIDSVELSFTLRKNGSVIEFLEYPTNWDESTITYANAPNNGFDTLSVIASFDGSGTTVNTERYAVNITDYFLAEQTEGSIGVAARSELIDGATLFYDIWSKENPSGYTAPELLIYGDVSFPIPSDTIAVTQDQKVRTGSTGNEATNYGEDQAISGLSRNGIYEFVGMMKFDIPGTVVGDIDSVHLDFTLRKNGSVIEFLEYPTNWDESTITYANAPNNGFDTLDVISSFDGSGTTVNTVRYSVNITDYFLAEQDNGSVGIAARSELVDGATLFYDIWSKENPSDYPAPELIIFGDVSIENTTSDSLLLADLTVNGETLSDFDSLKTIYYVEVPFEGSVPTVEATALAESATVEIINASSIQEDSTLVIVRYTQMGSSEPDSLIYTLYWEEGDPSTDASLSELLVDGETIPFFDPIKILYTVDLPYGTTEVPTVSATPTFPEASLEIVPGATLSDTTVITVTAQDVSVTYTVKIAWTVVAPNEDPTLAMIVIGSDSLDGFSSDVFAYSYENSTLDVPSVEVTPSDSNADVTMEMPTTLTPGEVEYAFIEVVAEDGETKKTYTIGFSTSVVITGLENQVDLSVFPNPFTNRMTIRSGKAFDSVHLFDLGGRLMMNVSTENTHELDLDVSSLPKGQYILQIGAQDVTKSINIIK